MKNLLLLAAICFGPFIYGQVYLDVQVTQQPSSLNSPDGIVVVQLMNYTGSAPVTYIWIQMQGTLTTNVYDSLKHGDMLIVLAVANGDTLASYTCIAEIYENVSSLNLSSSLNSTTSTTCDGAFSLETTAVWDSLKNYEIKDSLNNVLASSSDSIFGVNNLCPGKYYISLLGGTGSMSIIIDPIIITSNNPTYTAQVYSEVNPIDSCWSLATATITGNTAPYIYSFDNSAFSLDSTMDNLCSGMHLLKVVDINSDTLALYFPVADSTQQYTNGNQSGFAIDTLVTDFQNCSFDYNTPVDSANIISFNILDSVSSEWTTEIWQNGVSTVYTDTIVYSVTVTGQNLLVVNLFCPAKSGGQKLIRIEKLVTVSNLSNSIENRTIKFSVYPVPAQNTLNVETNLDNASYIIFDASGRELLMGDLNKSINIKQLNSGLYFIQLKKETLISTIRFVKQ